jgi:hypothetical protein
MGSRRFDRPLHSLTLTAVWLAALTLPLVGVSEDTADEPESAVVEPVPVGTLSPPPKDTDKAADSAAPKAPEKQPDAGAEPPPEPEPEPLVPAIPEDRMPKIELTVKPKSVSVGEVVTWRVEIVRRKDDRVHLSSTASFGDLEIKSKDKTETPADGDWVQETLSVELVGFEPGDVFIPAQMLTAVDIEGRMAELKAEEAHVTIKSVIGNEPEPALKDDTEAGEVVMEKDYLLLWIAGIIAGIGVVALLTLLARKLWAMRRPKPLPPPPPPRPAEEIALEKLESLKRSSLLEDGEIKEFHVRLSEAVREYIGNRYGFDSLELSSEELIQAMRRVSITKTEYDLVLDFLGETDLVKFAKMLPTVMESKDLLEQSFGFVDRTTPKIRETGDKDAPSKGEVKDA